MNDDPMEQYAQQNLNRIKENYDYLKKNEFSIDKIIALKESKKEAEFNEEYLNIKDMIPTFLFTIQETEDMIKSLKSNKIKGKDTEIKIYSDYIKDLKKNKTKKITSVQKKGDKIPVPQKTERINTIRSNNSEFEDLTYEIKERENKLNIIAEHAEQLKNDSISFRQKSKEFAQNYVAWKKYNSGEDDVEGLISVKKIICYISIIFVIVACLTTLLILRVHD